MITKPEKQQIKQLLQDPKWQVVERIVKMKLEEIRNQSNMKGDLWETAKATIYEEGQIQGINSLIQELYKLAQESE